MDTVAKQETGVKKTKTKKKNYGTFYISTVQCSAVQYSTCVNPQPLTFIHKQTKHTHTSEHLYP